MSVNKAYIPGSQSIQYCSLGSGSKGNGTLVSFAKTLLLLDCGFSTKETIKRLADKNIQASQITAILVTHEHSDHLKGVASFSNKFKIPVWMSKGTSLHKNSLTIKDNNLIDCNAHFKIKNLTITPVLVPHDAREAIQFIFEANKKKLGILTDVGSITHYIIQQYSACDVLMLEFNYDEAMLFRGSYPLKLKQRVSGRLGHLSNKQSIELLKHIDHKRLQLLIVAHKSAENNCSLIIEKEINDLKTDKKINFFIASQAIGFSWQRID